jgi:hypothetical protein
MPTRSGPLELQQKSAILVARNSQVYRAAGRFETNKGG